MATGQWNLLGKRPVTCEEEGMRVWLVAGDCNTPNALVIAYAISVMHARAVNA